MNFTCDKQELVNAVGTVSKAISPRAQLPILECVKMTAENNKVIFAGRDTDMSIECEVDCNVSNSGSAALNARMLAEIVKRLPDGIIQVDTDDNNRKAVIKCGKSKFSIQGLNPEEYPTPKTVNGNCGMRIAEKKLKQILKKTTPFASSTEAKRPILTGVLFECNGETLKAVSSDGYRIIVVDCPLKDNSDEFKAVIPSASLREIYRALEDEDREIDIIIGDNHVVFTAEGFRVYIRLLTGEYIGYNKIISRESTIKAEVNKIDLWEALERSQLIIAEERTKGGKVPVKFDVEENCINLSCLTARGSASDSVAAKVSGGNLTIGFNCQYLIDAVKSADYENITLEMSNPSNGVFIREENEEEKTIMMLLPVRLYG